MARFGSLGAGLAAGVESGLNRLDKQHTAEYQGMTDRHKMSQQGLTQLMNVALKYKEAGKQIPPEIQEMLNVLAKQTDRYSTHMGLGDAGMHEATMQALSGLPVTEKELKPITVQNQDNFDTKTFWSQKEAKDFLESVRNKEFVRDESGVIQDTGAGNWIIVDTPTARSEPEPTDSRTDKMKNAEALADNTGLSLEEAYLRLYPGEKVTDSRTTDQRDFEYWQKMPEGPEKDAFAKGANLNLTEDKGTELKQNLDYMNALPEGQEKEIWRKKLGVADSDPAKIELFKAYQNLPAEQQSAYDTFYKSDAKDSRTALMKNFDFLNSISDPEQKATFTALLQPDPSAPSIVREWAIVSSWPPEKQAQYLDYRKQISTMNMQQKMGIAEMIVAQAMGQNNTGAGNSFLNQVVTQPDAANPSVSDQGLGTQSNPIPITDDSNATLDQHKGKYVLFNGQIYLVPK